MSHTRLKFLTGPFSYTSQFDYITNAQQMLSSLKLSSKFKVHDYRQNIEKLLRERLTNLSDFSLPVNSSQILKSTEQNQDNLTLAFQVFFTAFQLENDILLAASIEVIRISKIWKLKDITINGVLNQMQKCKIDAMVYLAEKLKDQYPVLKRLVVIGNEDAVSYYFNDDNKKENRCNFTTTDETANNSEIPLQLALDNNSLAIAKIIIDKQNLNKNLFFLENYGEKLMIRYIENTNLIAFQFLLTNLPQINLSLTHLQTWAETKIEEQEDFDQVGYNDSLQKIRLIGDLIISRLEYGAESLFMIDENTGQNILHLAAALRNTEIIDHILDNYIDREKLMIVNSCNKTPFNIFLDIYQLAETDDLGYIITSKFSTLVEKYVRIWAPSDEILRQYFATYNDSTAATKRLLDFIKPNLADLHFILQGSKNLDIIFEFLKYVKISAETLDLIGTFGLLPVLEKLDQFQNIDNLQSNKSVFQAIENHHFSTAQLLISRNLGHLHDNQQCFYYFTQFLSNKNFLAMKNLIEMCNTPICVDDKILMDSTLMDLIKFGADEPIVARFLNDSFKIKAKDDVDDDGNDDEEKFYFSNKDLSQAMWVAIKDAGNLDLAGMLLSTYDIKINSEENIDFVPKAVEANLIEGACFLIESGFSIYEKENFSILHQAVEKSQSSVVQSVILRLSQDSLENHDSQDSSSERLTINTIYGGHSALYLAINNLDIETALLILSHPEIKVDQINQSGISALKLCSKLMASFDNKKLADSHQQQKDRNTLHRIVERICSFGENFHNPYDRLGYNLLHKAVLENDLSDLKFYNKYLDPNSITRNNHCQTALHLAIQQNSIFAVRILLSNPKIQINMPDSVLKLPIHYACDKISSFRSDSPVHSKNNTGKENTSSYVPNKIKDRQEKENQIRYEILESLLDDKPDNQNIDLAQTDSKGYNAWHYCIKNGYKRGVILLASKMDRDYCMKLSLQKDNKGRQSMHLLCKFTTEMQEDAGYIFKVFLELVNGQKDNEQKLFTETDNLGNTPLLTAYAEGNAILCECLIKNKQSAKNIRLAQKNNEGYNIFNLPVASDALLKRILKNIRIEPPWIDNEVHCDICETEFGYIKNKRHHCRHCGRAICGNCSGPELVNIYKFRESNEERKRVCQLCYSLI